MPAKYNRFRRPRPSHGQALTGSVTMRRAFFAAGDNAGHEYGHWHPEKTDIELTKMIGDLTIQIEIIRHEQSRRAGAANRAVRDAEENEGGISSKPENLSFFPHTGLPVPNSAEAQSMPD